MKKNTLFEVLPYESEQFKEAWNDFIIHRNQMKEPMTDPAIKRHLKFLASLGEEKAIQSINNSICSNWTGLFPPQETATNQSYPITKWDGKKYGA